MHWFMRSVRGGLLRLAIAIIAGAATWAALWGAGNAWALATFPDTLAPDQPIKSNAALVVYIAYSVVLSLLAGYITALVAGPIATPSVWSLALLQLAIGIYFEASYWALMPAWYHIVFLALIVPATLTGGRLHARGVMT